MYNKMNGSKIRNRRTPPYAGLHLVERIEKIALRTIEAVERIAFRTAILGSFLYEAIRLLTHH